MLIHTISNITSQRHKDLLHNKLFFGRIEIFSSMIVDIEEKLVSVEITVTKIFGEDPRETISRHFFGITYIISDLARIL